jgi:tRNA pseudouridine13 synthase
LWLEVEKSEANTHWVAEQLALAAGIPVRDVGYAGLKDRHGVTTQWFSVGLQEARNPDWEQWAIQGVVLLNAHRHNRKLKRGALNGNRFRIVVRELEGDTRELERRIEVVGRNGVPNYFGPQRFGINGDNVARGMRWLGHGGRISRNKRSIYLSSIRSFLFNTVLGDRVKNGNWNRLVDGEIAILNGRQSCFACSLPDEELEARCDEFDIHPSGPLPGRGGLQPEREALSMERAALVDQQEMIAALEKVGARAERRALRLLPEKLHYSLEGDVLTLSFTLLPGQYATTLLRELVTCSDGGHIPES